MILDEMHCLQVNTSPRPPSEMVKKYSHRSSMQHAALSIFMRITKSIWRSLVADI